MSTRRIRTALCGTALAASLSLVAACGGGSGGSGDETTKTPAAGSTPASASPSPSPTTQPQLVSGKPNVPGIVNAVLDDATCEAIVGAPASVKAMVEPAAVFQTAWPADGVSNPTWIAQSTRKGSTNRMQLEPGTCSYVAAYGHSVGFSFVVTDSRVPAAEPNDYALRGTLIAAARSGSTTVSLYEYRNSALNTQAFELAQDGEGGPAIPTALLPAGYMTRVTAALQAQIDTALR